MGGGSGYDISASVSTSATSGTKLSIGPVSFAPVTIGRAASAASTATWLLGGLAAALLFFLWRGR